MIDPVRLLKALVAVPSPSGSETAAQDVLADALSAEGLEARRSGRNLWTVIGEGGPTLLLNAHMDTVPASGQWTRNPHLPEEKDGRLYGLGSGDDKASLASMAAAVVASAEGDVSGTVIFASTCDEETGGEGLEILRREIPPVDAAVIGEPTALRVAIAQKGLIRIQAVAEGRAAHAARPHQGVNAIYKALEDIRRLQDMNFVKEHHVLGFPTVQVTEIEAGVGRNVIPPSCRYTVDVRTTPHYDNDFFVMELRRRIRSQIPVLRARMTPVETRPDDRLVRAALEATGTVDPVAFGGVSDFFHVRDLPAIVLGPGDPAESHQPDESVPLDQVVRAATAYRDLIRRWCNAPARRL